MLLSQSMVHGQHIGPWITATQEWKFTTKRICIWSKSVLIRWACGRTLWLRSTVEGRSACYVAYKMGLLKIICCLALTTPRLNCWWYASLLSCNATDKLGLGCIANNSPHLIRAVSTTHLRQLFIKSTYPPSVPLKNNVIMFPPPPYRR